MRILIMRKPSLPISQWVTAFAGIANLLLTALPSYAEEAAPPSPAMIKDYAGKWQVTDADAMRTCAVTLGTGSTIGGNVIEIPPDCAKTFPVMDEVAAWRLYENGDIVFADATRKQRLRFYTPDDSYIAVEEIDGIVRLTPAAP